MIRISRPKKRSSWKPKNWRRATILKPVPTALVTSARSGKTAHTPIRTRSDALWTRLETARETFYERKREEQVSHEKEMLKNLDIKMELADKAEQLAASDNWKETSEAFSKLFDEWKATGRTMHEKNEELWQRFITAKNVFGDRRSKFYEEQKEEFKDNYAVKLTIVEEAEAMAESTDWQATTNAYAKLMDRWKGSGRAQRDKENALWERMNAAKEIFFNNKRAHHKTIHVSMEDNLARKRALVNRAQQLERGADTREATDEMASMMDEWKEIGPVPREHHHPIWEEFSTARKSFFQRKDASRDQRRERAQHHAGQRIEQTREFLQKLIDEDKDEDAKLVDFREDIQNITPGPKATELKNHLENLIKQIENRTEKRKLKVEEVRTQLKEMEEKESGHQNRKSDGNKPGRRERDRDRKPRREDRSREDRKQENKQEGQDAVVAEAANTTPNTAENDTKPEIAAQENEMQATAENVVSETAKPATEEVAKDAMPPSDVVWPEDDVSRDILPKGKKEANAEKVAEVQQAETQPNASEERKASSTEVAEEVAQKAREQQNASESESGKDATEPAGNDVAWPEQEVAGGKPESNDDEPKGDNA